MDLNGRAIVLGSLLDGIPESVALGIALFAGKGLGFLMLVAIFLSSLFRDFLDCRFVFSLSYILSYTHIIAFFPDKHNFTASKLQKPQ